MEISLTHIIYFIIIFTFILFFVYWGSDYYKYDKFRVFLTFLSAIAVIFGILAIIIQGFNYNDTVKQRDTESFANLTKQFIHDILELFINNPDMEYFYKDLFGIKKINKLTKRNKTKEHQISMLIYSKLASIVYYIQVNKYSIHTKGIISRTNNIVNTFLQSDIFKSYWDIYDRKLAGDPIRIYLRKHFHIKSSVLKN